MQYERLGLLLLAFASIFGYMGTDMQACQARRRLYNDPHPDIKRAGRVWRPPPVVVPKWRRAIRQVHADIRAQHDPELLERYQMLRAELTGWNFLESATVSAFAGSILALVGSYL